MLDEAYERYSNSAFFLHIRDNHFYVSFPGDTYNRQIEDQATGVRLRLTLENFQAYSCHHRFPDIDLVLHVSDGIKDDNLFPVFAFQKHRKATGILYPYYTHRPGIIGQMKAGVDKYSWESKNNQLFWRGKNTGGHYTSENWRTFPRTKLVDRCHKSDMNTICDASFYGYVPSTAEEVAGLMNATFGGLKSPMPMPEQMQYKFVASLDGNGPCSGRIEKLG